MGLLISPDDKVQNGARRRFARNVDFGVRLRFTEKFASDTKENVEFYFNRQLCINICEGRIEMTVCPLLWWPITKDVVAVGHRRYQIFARCLQCNTQPSNISVDKS